MVWFGLLTHYDFGFGVPSKVDDFLLLPAYFPFRGGMLNNFFPFSSDYSNELKSSHTHRATVLVKIWRFRLLFDIFYFQISSQALLFYEVGLGPF